MWDFLYIPLVIAMYIPYVLMPWLVVKLFKRLRIRWRWLSYIVTGLIIFFYAPALITLADLIDPPSPDKDDQPLFFFLAFNTFIALPGALIIHAHFYSRFLSKRKKWPVPPKEFLNR